MKSRVPAPLAHHSIGKVLSALLVVALMIAAGCGGDDGSEATSTPTGPPPAQEVQDAVAGVLNVCIEKSFDPSADTGAAASHTDKLIRMFKRYDPDAKLAASDLKATTLRQATEQTRDNLRDRDCSPQDAQRLDDTLTTK